MKKLLAGLMLVAGIASADDNAYFKAGPLELNIPFKSASVTYMYNFNADENLIGGETPFIKLWDRLEGTLGAVTSLAGQGTPFVGGNLLLGNVLNQWVTLPEDLKIGGFGGYDFRVDSPIYGLKASYRIWG